MAIPKVSATASLPGTKKEPSGKKESRQAKGATFRLQNPPEKRATSPGPRIDQAIASCGGELRATIGSLVLADDFPERQVCGIEEDSEEGRVTRVRARKVRDPHWVASRPRPFAGNGSSEPKAGG